MKHQAEALVVEASRIGVELTIEQAVVLLDHLNWVLETTSKTNLTAVTEAASGLILHVVDSLAALPEIDTAPAGAMIDVGTGGGFPGIPLGVVSGRETVLLDSVKKKAALIDGYLCARPHLNFRVAAERAEEHAVGAAGGYAIVVARAVSSLPSLVELASPLLARGGRLVAMKGDLTADERNRGSLAASIAGMRELACRRYELSQSATHRVIITYEKIGEPEVSLPRRTGRAQKRPLA